ncbi:hypothetical protein SAMN05216233_101438 [Desulfoluna spongiiphila]|uniref:Uncharacterized protein n=1 Tax=Desulfoluna spongiiphila TaxID=419481 RepID=A0A1G5ATI7_9BACT|nr:hypothetical protein SAMN05216233_101438 [Desulfoluna spongiiphila]VVS91996.1 hypothetical protein DBB_15640 [Desulfoluna spongiiphila]
MSLFIPELRRVRNSPVAGKQGELIGGAVQNQKHASGGKVCHLESTLRMRFPLRSSGKITFAIDLD